MEVESLEDGGNVEKDIEDSHDDGRDDAEHEHRAQLQPQPRRQRRSHQGHRHRQDAHPAMPMSAHTQALAAQLT